jgi:alpha-1,3-rhamnosyl/mannosyltransferase
VQHPAVRVPARAPVIYTVHDLMPLQHPNWHTAKERWAFRAAYRAVAGAARVITVSQFVATGVTERLGVEPDRITVVPNGATGAFSTGSPEPGPGPGPDAGVLGRWGLASGGYVICVGTVSDRKNLLPVLGAIARLPELALVIAGPPGIGAERVDAEIARLGLDERVRRTGYVPDGELVALVAGAAALVHPSLDEGFGITPREALAAGVPAVVSGAGALPEVVGDAAIVVRSASPDDWAAAIAGLLGAPDRRAELVDAGRRRAATFTWERSARETLAVYEAVLATL